MAEKAKRTPEEPAAVDAGPPADEWGPAGPAVTAGTRRPLGKIKPRLENDPPPAGYHARWVNDTEGRIADALAAGYAFMNDRDGRPRKMVVGTKRTGGPLVAFRMMIPIEWYMADRAKLQEGREALLADMMRGKAGRGAEDGRYLPQRGGQLINSMTTSDGRLK
jgi:hypothetical protein